jgi:pimeloyl-ACP methyl ester carboxylesterase
VIIFALMGAPAMAAPPGTLSDARPVVETPAGAQAWKMRYWTRSDKGAEIEVTGMVVAPREAMPAAPRKVLAWTHGTWGVVEKCAPLLGANFFTATPSLGEAIRRGYTVVAPDYPGLGSAMPHPYLGGISTANSVLDAVRAARAIPGAATGSSFAVWGESQGGHAALWTGQRAQLRPRPNLDRYCRRRISSDNSQSARDPGVPVLIAQNPKDLIEGAAVTQTYARRLCRNGTQLRYITINGQGHETSAKDTAGVTLDWIDARFAGRPAPSDCGRI